MEHPYLLLPRPTGSNRTCCVPDCNSVECRNRDLSFYRIPGKRYEEERKEKWLAAIGRKMPDGGPWFPSSEARVCSLHFIGGKKSDHVNDPAYIPTIFPRAQKRKAPDGEVTNPQDENLPKRNSRIQDKPKKFQSFLTDQLTMKDGIEEPEIAIQRVARRTVTRQHRGPRSIGTQTNPDHIEPDPVDFMFCGRDGNDVCIQTEIYIRPIQKPKKIIVSDWRPNKNLDCGPSEIYRPGFKGFSDINSDASMRYLTGISRDFFSVLLQTLDGRREVGKVKCYRRKDKENRLLLVLMRLKLGLAPDALSCIFHLHLNTVLRMFGPLLKTLAKETASWICWPSREHTRKNLPTSCQDYPNYRCSVNCLELPMDNPATPDVRELMYSDRLGKCTQKILIASTPDGVICKISKAYGGSTSIRFMVDDSKFLEDLEENDGVFINDCPEIRPEVIKRKLGLVAEGEKQNVASIKQNSEQGIQRIKLLRVLGHISMDLVPHVEALIHMCCIIANGLGPPEERNDN